MFFIIIFITSSLFSRDGGIDSILINNHRQTDTMLTSSITNQKRTLPCLSTLLKERKTIFTLRPISRKGEIREIKEVYCCGEKEYNILTV